MMKIEDNGTRFRDYNLYGTQLHQPYDYKRYGLLSKIMSHKIWSTKNPVLRYILNIYEQELEFCMQYVDILHNFYNYNWKNR